MYIRYLWLRPISTQENFPRTQNFPKISLLKLENFQLQNFFRRKICVGQSHFTKFSVCGKFSGVEMGFYSSTGIQPDAERVIWMHSQDELAYL